MKKKIQANFFPALALSSTAIRFMHVKLSISKRIHITGIGIKFIGITYPDFQL